MQPAALLRSMGRTARRVNPAGESATRDPECQVTSQFESADLSKSVALNGMAGLRQKRFRQPCQARIGSDPAHFWMTAGHRVNRPGRCGHVSTADRRASVSAIAQWHDWSDDPVAVVRNSALVPRPRRRHRPHGYGSSSLSATRDTSIDTVRPVTLETLREFTVARSLFTPLSLQGAIDQFGFVQADTP